MPVRAEVYGNRVTIHTNCRPIRWASKLGLTLGSHIFLGPPAAQVWPALVAHEFAHVVQWRDMGTFGFLKAYIGGLITHGYGLKHPLERDAHAYDAAHANDPVFIGIVLAMGGRA